jgi:transposase
VPAGGSGRLRRPSKKRFQKSVGPLRRVPGVANDVSTEARGSMADPLHVDDGFWAVPEPLLPERVSQRIGRPRVDDRIAFTAILFVLVTGVPWRVLPRELCCSGVTAWRRLRDWQAAGVWDRLLRELLGLLNALGRDSGRGVPYQDSSPGRPHLDRRSRANVIRGCARRGAACRGTWRLVWRGSRVAWRR